MIFQEPATSLNAVMTVGFMAIFPLTFLSNVFVEPEPQHVIVKCLAEPFAQEVVIDPGRIFELKVVLREADLFGEMPAREANSEGRGITSDRTVNRRTEAVPECRLDATFGKKLAHALERGDGFLHGLRRKTVHQIRMHQNTGITEATSDASHLRHGNSLFHQGQ